MKRKIMLTLLAAFSLTVLAADGIFRPGNRSWGISVSYSLKWYNYGAGGRRHDCNFFGEDGKMQGIRFGVPFEPRLQGDWGVSTGVFGEVYSCKNDLQTMRIEEAGMYFPVRGMWSHNFNSNVSLRLSTGVGLTVGLLQRIIDPTNSLNKGHNIPFDDGTPRRFNCYWEWEAGMTYRMFRFTACYSLGLTPSRRFLSTAGEKTEFFAATPMVISVTAGLVF